MILKNPWYESLKRLSKNKTAVVCGIFILFICFVAVFAREISPYPFDEQDINKILFPPSQMHWMGTDDLGRDLLSRLIHGARISMAIGIVTALISLFVGVIYGTIAGWFGGYIDSLMMRVIDILYSIPSLIFIILTKIIFEATVHVENPEIRSLIGILAALSIAGWLTLARVVRGQVLQVKTSLYVESARALGAQSMRIILRQILPNITGPIVVLITLQIPLNILAESFLSFLGLGLQPPYSSWGLLSAEGWRSLRFYPHLMIAPGVALFLTMLAFNLFGDGLKDALDPPSQKSL